MPDIKNLDTTSATAWLQERSDFLNLSELARFIDYDVSATRKAVLKGDGKLPERCLPKLEEFVNKMITPPKQ